MNFKIFIIIIILVLTCFISTIVSAETYEEAYLQTLDERLDIDMQIFERIGKAIDENNIEKYFLILITEQDEFQKSHNIYKNRPEGLDTETIKVAERLKQASFDIINGIEFLLSLPEYSTEEDFEKGWNQIILVHNHPSGDPEPSEDDLVITKRLVEAGKILGIEVFDHIIVVKDGFFSFKDKKLI